jgi:hypothetical protein
MTQLITLRQTFVRRSHAAGGAGIRSNEQIFGANEQILGRNPSD